MSQIYCSTRAHPAHERMRSIQLAVEKLQYLFEIFERQTARNVDTVEDESRSYCYRRLKRKQAGLLLADENIALRTANQRQRQKRSKPISSISQGGVLSVQEGRDRTQNIQNVEMTVGEQSIDQSRKRAPPRCSICRSYEHTARTCAQRYSTN